MYEIYESCITLTLNSLFHNTNVFQEKEIFKFNVKTQLMSSTRQNYNKTIKKKKKKLCPSRFVQNVMISSGGWKKVGAINNFIFM